MKTSQIAILVLATVLLQTASSQTYPDAALPATNAPTMTQASTDAVPAAASTAVDTNIAMVQTNVAATSTGTASTPAADETSQAVPPAASTMPPIVFQDVPLTTAIETLARLANINYLLDPSINYSTSDQSQNGGGKAEPTLSVRWENVTYQQALVALLDNYGLQMVENPKTKIYKITTKDPTAPPPLITRVVQLKYASTSNMAYAVTSSLTDKRSRVLPDIRTSQMVVVATEDEQSTIDNLVNQLDRPTRQVLIETKIVELSSNPQTEKGIDWSGTLAAQNVSFGNNLNGTPSTIAPGYNSLAPLSVTNGLVGFPQELGQVVGQANVVANTQNGFGSIGFLNADGLKAVVSFLNSSADAQVVSTPRIVTLDNEMATISVTRAFPIFNTTAGTQGSPGGSELTYSNLGTILEVTPRISANDYIWLKVTPSVSSFFGTVTKIVGGVENQADEFDTRTMDTQVLIPNSHTLVMGGMVKDNPNSQMTKVPFLGDIPFLGLAFRHENKSEEKNNLLLFITPTIVKDSDFKATTSTFLDSQPRTMKDPLNPKTMYDSAYPRGDWSDPLTPNVK